MYQKITRRISADLNRNIIKDKYNIKKINKRNNDEIEEKPEILGRPTEELTVVQVSEKKSHRFFLISRIEKKDRFFFHPVYMKFINKLMRKGYKNRYLTFFYNLLKAHKKRVFFLFSKILGKKDKLAKLPTFSLVFNIVFRFLTLRLELKLRKFKKREVLTPSPISPRRGWRLGLGILFKNAKNSAQKVKRSRKFDFLYRILDEVWLTFRGNSATTKDIIEFTNNILDNTEHYRDTELFSLRQDRRSIIPKNFFSQLKKKKKIIINRKTISYVNARYMSYRSFLVRKSKREMRRKMKRNQRIFLKNKKIEHLCQGKKKNSSTMNLNLEKNKKSVVSNSARVARVYYKYKKFLIRV